MADLIQAFFERDLTEGEVSELEKLLQSSTDQGARFADLSEQAYLATGLPPHVWPGKPISIPHIGGMGLGMKLFLTLCALGIGTVVYLVNRPSPPTLPIPQAAPTLPPIQSLPVAKPKLSIPKKMAAQPVPTQWTADELSVVVENAKPSLVTVRILDSTGREIRDLYAGVLDPGHWAFRWDGQGADGKPVPSGEYRIQVQNGSSILSKSVNLNYK
jgi:hypothetical protein